MKIKFKNLKIVPITTEYVAFHCDESDTEHHSKNWRANSYRRDIGLQWCYKNLSPDSFAICIADQRKPIVFTNEEDYIRYLFIRPDVNEEH